MVIRAKWRKHETSRRVEARPSRTEPERIAPEVFAEGGENSPIEYDGSLRPRGSSTDGGDTVRRLHSAGHQGEAVAGCRSSNLYRSQHASLGHVARAQHGKSWSREYLVISVLIDDRRAGYPVTRPALGKRGVSWTENRDLRAREAIQSRTAMGIVVGGLLGETSDGRTWKSVFLLQDTGR
jgi:hypothetical protein